MHITMRDKNCIWYNILRKEDSTTRESLKNLPNYSLISQPLYPCYKLCKPDTLYEATCKHYKTLKK